MNAEPGKIKSDSTTDISSLKTGIELSGSLLCKVTGSNLELAIGVHPEKLRNKGRGNTYRIESPKFHTGLLKFCQQF